MVSRPPASLTGSRRRRPGTTPCMRSMYCRLPPPWQRTAAPRRARPRAAPPCGRWDTCCRWPAAPSSRARSTSAWSTAACAMRRVGCVVRMTRATRARSRPHLHGCMRTYEVPSLKPRAIVSRHATPVDGRREGVGGGVVSVSRSRPARLAAGGSGVRDAQFSSSRAGCFTTFPRTMRVRRYLRMVIMMAGRLHGCVLSLRESGGVGVARRGGSEAVASRGRGGRG